MKKTAVFTVAVLQFLVVGIPSYAQVDAGAQSSEIESSVDVDLNSEPRADAGAQSISGGNVFDFSGAESRPPAPGLPSFAGGPCTGSSFGASTSLAGVAVGAGRSSIDESCQRRNWVQTLIGASQHMPPEEAKFLLRVSVEVMRDDPYLSDALERAGLPAPDDEEEAARKEEGNARGANLSTKSSTCRVMVSENAPLQVIALMEARGCSVDKGE
jgi:hypothetical protein